MRISRKLAFSYPLLKFGQQVPINSRTLTISSAHSAPTNANANAKTTFLVDGTALMYKAYYAVPPMEVNHGSEKKQVGAVAGFCSMLTNMMLPTPVDQQDSSVLVFFDSKGPTFRNELFEEYKATRGPSPEDLHPQFEIAYEALEAFGYPAMSAPGFEADDIIASMSRHAHINRPVVIIASDKDFMQCVNDRCFVMCPTKKQVFTPLEVHKRYEVEPSQMSDYQALMGDSVDNIKGIPGIGPKTAVRLLSEFGSLKGILENAEKIQNVRIRNLVMNNKESALLASALVTLRDVPADKLLTLSSHSPPQPLAIDGEASVRHVLTAPTRFNYEGALAFYDKYQMRAAGRNLRAKAGIK